LNFCIAGLGNRLREHVPHGEKVNLPVGSYFRILDTI
jgi:hypothetical protein